MKKSVLHPEFKAEAILCRRCNRMLERCECPNPCQHGKHRADCECVSLAVQARENIYKPKNESERLEQVEREIAAIKNHLYAHHGKIIEP